MRTKKRSLISVGNTVKHVKFIQDKMIEIDKACDIDQNLFWGFVQYKKENSKHIPIGT